MLEKWTNTSSPCSREMKPKPLSALKNLTVPCITKLFSDTADRPIRSARSHPLYALLVKTTPGRYNNRSERRQLPKPGRFCSRFECLSRRFSFSDFAGFLAFSFFGDL